MTGIAHRYRTVAWVGAPAWRVVVVLLLPAMLGGAEMSGAESPAGPATLPVGQSASLPEANAPDRLAAEQQQIADRYRRLEEILLRMAELSRGTDPRRAALLRQVVEESKQRLVGLQFEKLVELLTRDQLAPALAGQEELQADLRALLQLLLTESRAERTRSEQARLRDYIRKIAELINQQQSILGRTLGGEDPKRLAEEQNRVASRTGELARTIRENEEGQAGAGSAKPAQASGKPGDAKPGGAKPNEGKPAGQAQPGKPGQSTSKGGSAKAKPGPADSASKPGQGKSASDAKSHPAEPKTPPDAPGSKDGSSKSGSSGGKSGQAKPAGGKPAQGSGKPSPDSPPSEAKPSQDPRPPSRDEEQANPARKRLEAAEERMRQAEEKLKKAQREGAQQDQQQALEELKQAKANLERILRQLREEEIERVLASLEARFAKMLQMQRAVYDATVRLKEAMAGKASREHEIEAGRLSVREAEIGLEADRALNLLREDGTSVAFAEAVEQIRADIRQVEERLKAAKVDDTTQSIEEDILAALEEMIQALQKEMKQRQQRRGQPPPPGQPQDPPLVDVLAELKMIRALQMRVNTRTARYSKLLGEREQAEQPELVEAIRRLAERQQRIYQITRDLEMGRNR